MLGANQRPLRNVPFPLVLLNTKADKWPRRGGFLSWCAGFSLVCSALGQGRCGAEEGKFGVMLEGGRPAVTLRSGLLRRFSQRSQEESLVALEQGHSGWLWSVLLFP